MFSYRVLKLFLTILELRFLVTYRIAKEKTKTLGKKKFFGWPSELLNFTLLHYIYESPLPTICLKIHL